MQRICKEYAKIRIYMRKYANKICKNMHKICKYLQNICKNMH